jgi:hypothetical protein
MALWGRRCLADVWLIGPALVAGSHIHPFGLRIVTRGWIHRTRHCWSLCLLLLLLGYDFSSVEFHQHRTVRFEFFNGDREAEVVQEEELQLEMV